MAGFDQGWALGSGLAARQTARKDMLSDEARQMRASDLIETRNGILSKMPTLLGPNGEKTPEYEAAFHELTQAQQGLGDLYHPVKAPGALQKDWHFLLEKVHGITAPKGKKDKSSDSSTDTAAAPEPAAPSWGQAELMRRQAASMQGAQAQAQMMTAALPLSPGQQAMRDYDNSLPVQKKKIQDTLDMAKRMGFNMKNTAIKPVSGPSGAPYKGPDGRWYKPVMLPTNEMGSIPMPEGWKPNTKAVRGTVVNSKSHGWIQTWVDPYDTSHVVGWQPMAPGSRYAGISSGSTATDPYGVTTTTSRSSMPASGSSPVDIDLSSTRELPENYNGEDIPETGSAATTSAGQSPSADAAPSGSPSKSSAPTPSAPSSVKTPTTHPQARATPASLRSQVPAPPTTPAATSPAAPAAVSTFPVDANGHIPEADIQKRGLNRYAVQIANDLLDGADVSKVSLKDRGKAQDLAAKYGWGGQGMFTPRETLQIKEGASFLNKMANSPALKVLDGGFWSNIPMTGASTDPTKEGFFGRIGASAAGHLQSPQQQEFMRLYRQLDAMAIGLRALVQSGRGTQKQTDLLISELPNPINTPNSKDAQERLKLVQQELEIAAKTGHLRGIDEMQKSFENVGSTPKGGLSLDDFMAKHKPNLPGSH